MSTIMKNDGNLAKEQGNPITGLQGPVGSGGLQQSNPDVDGQVSIPCTIGHHGILPAQESVGAGLLASEGVILPADMGVGTLSPPRVSEGAAISALSALSAMSAILDINASYAINASSTNHATLASSNTISQNTISQCPMPSATMPACHNPGTTKGQALNIAAAETAVEDFSVPEKDYNLYLASGARISPIGKPQDLTNNYNKIYNFSLIS